MGLDVYLYHCPNREEAKKAEEQYEKQSEENWNKFGKKYEKLSKSEKEQIEKENRELAVALKCTGQYESYESVTRIEKDSSIHPEHMFKIGYLRSSYNEGGINRYFETLGLMGLYEIFNAGDDYEFTPDWIAALANVEETIQKYEEILNSPSGSFRIMEVSHNIFTDPGEAPQSEADAMEVVKKEQERNSKSPSSFGDYSNRAGHFFWSGLDVVALIPGMNTVLGKHQCTYVVYRVKKEGEEKKDWYLKALEVTKEMIQFVLDQPDPQNYYFHWSS